MNELGMLLHRLTVTVPDGTGMAIPTNLTLKQIRNEAVLQRLKYYEWNRKQTAKSLGISYRQMFIEIKALAPYKVETKHGHPQ